MASCEIFGSGCLQVPLRELQGDLLVLRGQEPRLNLENNPDKPQEQSENHCTYECWFEPYIWESHKRLTKLVA